LTPRALQLGVSIALSLAATVAAPAALGQPAPDPAPAQPAVAPDPAPAAAPSVSAPASPPPSASAPAPAGPSSPPPPTETTLTRQASSAEAPARRHAAGQTNRTERGVVKRDMPPRRTGPDVGFLKVTSLLPDGGGPEDSSSMTFFLAAAALLALALASGSLVRILARMMPPTAVLVIVVAAFALPATAKAESVTASCATPSADVTCGNWYSTPSVTVQWTFSPTAGAIVQQGCGSHTFFTEGAALNRCEVRWDGTTIDKKIWVRIDRTAPQVTGLQPARAPDHDGWFNHPVGVSFRGSDALSGVAGCTALTYSGPDGAGRPLAGSCTDVAGNSRAASLPLNYDATAPAAPEVSAAPRDAAVRLEWTPADQAQAEVTRIGAGAASVVYRGAAGSFTDRGVRNEQPYRYVVKLVDQAGNAASGRASAVPTASPLLTPRAHAKLGRPPLFTWRTVRHASYYNVQLFRGARKLLSRWPRTNQLQLKRRWRYAGKMRRLRPGRYCWYVWPGFGARRERDYGRLLGRRCFRFDP
jgi:hypothetical protein